MDKQKTARKILPSDETEALVLNVLGSEPLHVDDIRNQTTLPISGSAALVMMELKGMVRQVGGMNYVAVREEQPDYTVQEAGMASDFSHAYAVIMAGSSSRLCPFPARINPNNSSL